MCFVEDNIAHFKKLMTFCKKKICILILFFNIMSKLGSAGAGAGCRGGGGTFMPLTLAVNKLEGLWHLAPGPVLSPAGEVHLQSDNIFFFFFKLSLAYNFKISVSDLISEKAPSNEICGWTLTEPRNEDSPPLSPENYRAHELSQPPVWAPGCATKGRWTLWVM